MFGMLGKFGLIFLTAFSALVGAADIPACKRSVCDKTLAHRSCVTCIMSHIPELNFEIDFF